MSADWIRATAVADIEVGRAAVAKHGELQIAIFRLGESEFRAVDNLCPHEGYPLVQGYVKDCVLTCAWHNFKFDLTDGHCVQGDEDVRAYDVRVVDGHVEIDVGLTIAQATRTALARYPEPAVLRLLFFGAHFVNRTAPLDLAEGRRTPWDQLTAVRAEALRERVLDAVFGDHYVRPIVVAHVLKTGLSALQEHASLGEDPQASVPLLAARRFLDSPVRERQVRRSVEEAVRFIGAGKPPRRLTSAP